MPNEGLIPSSATRRSGQHFQTVEVCDNGFFEEEL